jgi:hypothetical protein
MIPAHVFTVPVTRFTVGLFLLWLEAVLVIDTMVILCAMSGKTSLCLFLRKEPPSPHKGVKHLSPVKALQLGPQVAL